MWLRSKKPVDTTLSVREASSRHYPIPIYLNQRIVFDLLAIAEDGVAQLSQIRVAAEDEDEHTSGARAALGTGNPFALIGVSFGTRVRSSGRTNREVSQERVHTPTSLFGKVRETLESQGLIRALETWDDWRGLLSGDFVEFKAVLSKNPLVDTLESLVETMAFAKSVSSISNDPKEKRQQADQLAAVAKQLSGLLDALRGRGFVDLVADMSESMQRAVEMSHGMPRAVVMVDSSYFNDPTMSDLIDGEFWVIGKVTRVVRDVRDGVNLLRKTGLARLPDQTIDQLRNAFSALADSSGFDFPTVETSVAGPVMQVIPLAIFS